MCKCDTLMDAPYYYACDFFGCDQSEMCSKCFRKKYPNWQTIDSELRIYFYNYKYQEHDVKILKNLSSGTCKKAHELVYCQGVIY